MEKPHLLPLLRPPTTSTAAAATPPTDEVITLNSNKLINLISATSTILLRLSFLLLIIILSIWANHEASKGFAITTVNESPDTFSGKRFQLFYVSNDEATRLAIKAGKINENFLYHDLSHDSRFKKPVRQVILKLSYRNLSEDITVESSEKQDEFILNISPSVMEKSNFRHVMSQAVQKGMARVWLWDGRGNAPANLINGIVEYMTNNNPDGSPAIVDLVGRQPCWKHNDDERAVADFLGFCERRRPGFVRRLNQAMRDSWDDEIFDVVVGQPVVKLCREYELLRYNLSSV